MVDSAREVCGSDLLGIWRMDRIPNSQIRELLCGVVKRINESVLYQFGYIERMENNRIAKRVYVRECMDSHLVG